MQTLLLAANNVTSVFLMLACWWLAHSYAAAGYPYGRPIAIGWAMLGMSVMATVFARNLYIDPNGFIVLTKLILIALCLMIARRVTMNKKLLDNAAAHGLSYD